MASLTLHLVTWNGAKYLPHLFASLREQTMQEWGLVVVDNGSRDDTVVVLEKELSHFRTNMRKEIRVVRNAENRGFAGGHNQAFGISNLSSKGGSASGGKSQISNGEQYIQLLNQDTVLAPDYLEKLVQFLDAHPDVGAVQGALCRWDFAGDVRTDTIDTLGLRVLRTRQVVEIGVGEPLTQFCTTVQNCVSGSYDGRDCHGPRTGLAMTQHVEVFGVSGALPMYRMAALADVALRGLEVGGGRLERLQHPTPRRNLADSDAGGHASISLSSRARGSLSRGKMEGEKTGSASSSVSVHHPLDPLSDPFEIFDSTFFSYKEDVDLAYRLRSAGWKAYCVPAVRAWHDRTAGVHRTRRQRSVFERRLSWRNHLLMLVANEHSRTFARDWWRIVGYELGKLAYIIVREPRTLAAVPSLIRLLPRAVKKRQRVMGKYRAKVEEMGRWFSEV